LSPDPFPGVVGVEGPGGVTRRPSPSDKGRNPPPDCIGGPRVCALPLRSYGPRTLLLLAVDALAGGVSNSDEAGGEEEWEEELEFALGAAKREDRSFRTPSTALKKFDEPTLRADEMASLVGPKFFSSLSS
jgi:hypothetical protein